MDIMDACEVAFKNGYAAGNSHLPKGAIIEMLNASYDFARWLDEVENLGIDFIGTPIWHFLDKILIILDIEFSDFNDEDYDWYPVYNYIVQDNFPIGKGCGAQFYAMFFETDKPYTWKEWYG